VSVDRGKEPGSALLKVYLINQSAHRFIAGLLFPVLILLVLDKGLSLFEAGTIMAIYSGTAVLMELPTGGLADSIGRKKVYMISLLVHIIGVLSFLVSFNYLTVALAAFFMGLGRALSSGSIDAWFVDEFKAAAPGGNLQKALAKANICIPIGLGLGSLIGGLLPMTAGRYLNAELGITIFAANLLVVLVADVLQISLTNSMIEEKVVLPGRGSIKDGFRNVPSIVTTSVTYGVRNRSVLVLLLVMMAFGFGISGLELLWQPRVNAIMGDGAQTWIMGVLAAAYFVVSAVGSFVVTPFCRLLKDDYVRVMGVLLVVMGALMAILAMQNEILMFSTFYLLVYMVLGMTQSPYGSLYNDEVPTEHRSTMLSFQSLVMQGGGLMGSIMLGYVAGASGIPAAWFIAAAVVAFSSLGFFYLRAHKARAALGKTPQGGEKAQPPLTS
jgi:MFS family permease